MKKITTERIQEEKNRMQRKILINLLILLFEMIAILLVAFLEYVYASAQGVIAKPIIYLYPESETEISIKLNYPEKLTTSYPKYTSQGWNVIASTDGTLIDTSTGRKLYSLYWEGVNNIKANEKEGFIVKGEDTAKFLEEKLDILGLTEREAEEFIVYWLPKLEENKYNFIRFEKIEKINEEMPLEITPNPDTLIRVWMEYKPLKKKIDITEQKLETPERKGFVVVEWGGTEIK